MLHWRLGSASSCHYRCSSGNMSGTSQRLSHWRNFAHCSRCPNVIGKFQLRQALARKVAPGDMRKWGTLSPVTAMCSSFSGTAGITKGRGHRMGEKAARVLGQCGSGPVPQYRSTRLRSHHSSRHPARFRAFASTTPGNDRRTATECSAVCCYTSNAPKL